MSLYSVARESNLLAQSVQEFLLTPVAVLTNATCRIHTWHNRSDEWARMVYVLIPAKKIVVDGKNLGEAWHD